MGKRNGFYHPDFPKGTKAKVANRDVLEQFAQTWRYHHPLTEDQLGFHGAEAAAISFPEFFTYLDTLARVYFEKGKIDQAIAVQTEAVAQAPADSKTMFQRSLDKYHAAKSSQR